MKRGMLHLPKVSLSWLQTFISDSELTAFREKMAAAQTETAENVAIEVTSDELETVLDLLPEPTVNEDTQLTHLRQLILNCYQNL
ncbi:MAG TPA: hypothetical protein VF209_04425 [Patescibacteria group bacterium]